MGVHAKLSPSSAERWTRCPGSVALTASMPDETSEYAEEGSRAHKLAEICLREGIDPKPANGEIEYPLEMQESVQTYLDFVRQWTGGPHWIEQWLNISPLIPGCFGTADFVAVAGEELIIVDLKYGQGLKIYAEDNRQLLLYALGALHLFDLAYDIQSVRMIVVQPRLDHIDEASLLTEDLIDAGKWLSGQAAAVNPNAPLIPGKKQCQWCLAKAICKARAEANLKAAMEEFGPLPAGDTLSLEDIGRLLPKLDDIKAWTGDLQKYALKEAVSGEKVPGYKLVKGRSYRRWKADAAETIETLPESDQLVEKKILGIGAAEKLLGKKHPVFEACCHKPPAKPTLVPVSDRRKEITPRSTAAEDFK